MCVGLVFFNDTATTEIYTLSLHDALPILDHGTQYDLARDDETAKLNVYRTGKISAGGRASRLRELLEAWRTSQTSRSEEHTSELQSRQYLVCRLLLEKKIQNDLSLLKAST